MEQYPKIIEENIKSVTSALRAISRYRDQDITDRNNFPAIFFLGRKVGKIPSSSIDIVASDRLGDINYTADYLYIVVDDSGAAWRRIALETW